MNNAEIHPPRHQSVSGFEVQYSIRCNVGYLMVRSTFFLCLNEKNKNYIFGHNWLYNYPPNNLGHDVERIDLPSVLLFWAHEALFEWLKMREQRNTDWWKERANQIKICCSETLSVSHPCSSGCELLHFNSNSILRWLTFCLVMIRPENLPPGDTHLVQELFISAGRGCRTRYASLQQISNSRPHF